VRRRDFLARGGVGAGALAAGVLPAAAAVSVGLERLGSPAAARLRGRRVGLVGHAASVSADGRHAIEVLRSAGVDVVRLFGPEHGLRGLAAAGEKVEGGVDAASGLRVVSLYGAKTRPSAEDLHGLDALVVDLQDAGVRFYTYASTMLLCVEAAAEAGVELVVLDRPNPIGGERVDGPVRDPSVPGSLFLTPGPLVHGLTLGEMARLWNASLARPGRVEVVPMAGWARSMAWAETGREWVRPSPNLRTAEAALAYPGTCLVEGTNASEGRGTDAPFLLVGAPWVKAEALAREASGFGFALAPASFTPTASAAAPSPKHLGVPCRGVRVSVADRDSARPWAFGLGLLGALRRLHPECEWIREGATIDTLVGTRGVRAALDRGAAVEAILDAGAAGLDRWREERRGFLLY
jgi:uncharacterized protein YbbC (DUF1343 family)